MAESPLISILFGDTPGKISSLIRGMVIATSATSERTQFRWRLCSELYSLVLHERDPVIQNHSVACVFTSLGRGTLPVVDRKSKLGLSLLSLE
jgi:hypothetical protein